MDQNLSGLSGLVADSAYNAHSESTCLIGYHRTRTLLQQYANNQTYHHHTLDASSPAWDRCRLKFKQCSLCSVPLKKTIKTYRRCKLKLRTFRNKIETSSNNLLQPIENQIMSFALTGRRRLSNNIADVATSSSRFYGTISKKKKNLCYKCKKFVRSVLTNKPKKKQIKTPDIIALSHPPDPSAHIKFRRQLILYIILVTVITFIFAYIFR